jgi:hypothetical protein
MNNKRKMKKKTKKKKQGFIQRDRNGAGTDYLIALKISMK